MRAFCVYYGNLFIGLRHIITSKFVWIYVYELIQKMLLNLLFTVIVPNWVLQVVSRLVVAILYIPVAMTRFRKHTKLYKCINSFLQQNQQFWQC